MDEIGVRGSGMQRLASSTNGKRDARAKERERERYREREREIEIERKSERHSDARRTEEHCNWNERRCLEIRSGARNCKTVRKIPKTRRNETKRKEEGERWRRKMRTRASQGEAREIRVRIEFASTKRARRLLVGRDLPLEF